MKILLTALIIVINLNDCIAQNKKDFSSELDLNGVITIHIKSIDSSENAQVKLTVYHSFPQADANFVQDSLITGKSDIYIKSPFRTLGKVYLSISNSTYQLLGIPGDTIQISVQNNSKNVKNLPFVSFQGKNRKIQQYYQAKKEFMKDPDQACMNEGMSAANLVVFQNMMDTTYEKLSWFWIDYQKNHKLPDWFKAYETNVLNYSDAWLRVYMVWYQTEYQKKKQIIPDSYYAFKSRVMIKNEGAIYQYEYLRYLREDLFWQMHHSNKDMSLISWSDYAKQELGEGLGDFVGIWELSSSVGNPNLIEKKFNNQVPAQYQYLVDYVQQRAKSNIKLLKYGDKAPNFALVDPKDSLVTLSQYKGQVVYLSFWFTTCGACVEEMPYENKLVDQFKNKPVKIVSICIGTPGAADSQQLSKWKAASKRFGLKTVDLYSNPAWTKTLTKNYLVSAYPHYVLIGADGNIIENFADKPSQGIASKIQKALADVIK